MSKPKAENGQQLAVLLFEAPYPDSLSDDEIEALMTQEPLPPNQGFQLAAEEFPSDDNHNENQPTLNYHEY